MGMIEALNSQIEELEKNGHGGGLDMSVAKPTRDGFLSNVAKL